MRPDEPRAVPGSAVRGYDLPEASVDGDGLCPEVRDASSAELRALGYGGRI
jgi:hypothetical protein